MYSLKWQKILLSSDKQGQTKESEVINQNLSYVINIDVDIFWGYLF